uniref:C2H2-type domain-containing protein n=1 Tax=Haemonchus placei TaxID=6290 RepID=A0A0N4X8L4_HAEPC
LHRRLDSSKVCCQCHYYCHYYDLHQRMSHMKRKVQVLDTPKREKS